MLVILKAYNLQFTELKNIRSEQEKFRYKIINRDKYYVISNTNYDIDNSLLLNEHFILVFINIIR